MRASKRYLLCTADELAVYLADTIHRTEKGWAIQDVDICTLGEDDTGEALEIIAERVWSWYGIKTISSGFDSDYLEIAGNYYGGGGLCATDIEVSNDFDKGDAVLSIGGLIFKTLELEDIRDTTLLFVDLETERGE